GKNDTPLEYKDVPDPSPKENEILIKVSVSGVCHTEMDEIEGRTAPPNLPVIPGHQVVGRVAGMGPKAGKFKEGARVGVAWIYSSCGHCDYCRTGNENLCESFKATGRDADGGYAEYMTVPEDYAYPIPEVFEDSQAAPLLCAGAVGYRALRLAKPENNQNIGLTGFGASGHLVISMIRHRYPDSKIFVFARRKEEREFAEELGAHWTGESTDKTPELLHSIIDTTPVWKPDVEALKNLRPGGRLVINAIRKLDVDKEYLMNLNYHEYLWMEKEIKSVANVARQDVKECLDLSAEVPIIPEIREFTLKDANKALVEMKHSKIRGAKVLVIS
ncbi:MAG TPA: zinc-dependent alcohol dehydrogenase family protein, partial [Bacteroidales bacterium]|nr:zinc-dependent alcohol dehydrogenase family protein [Bacteroidales bacterium]